LDETAFGPPLHLYRSEPIGAFVRHIVRGGFFGGAMTNITRLQVWPADKE
jgi:hypothetical protein